MPEKEERAWRTDFAQKIATKPGQKQVSLERLVGEKPGGTKPKEEK